MTVPPLFKFTSSYWNMAATAADTDTRGQPVSVANGHTESGTHVSINPRLRLWIGRVVQDLDAPSDLRKRCEAIISTSPRNVSMSSVEAIAKYASERKEKGKTPKSVGVYAGDFLEGVKYFFAEGPPPAKRDYSSETPVQKIRNDAAAREYARMTRSVDQVRCKGGNFSFATELKSTNKESVAVFNCLLTVFGAGVFTYFATGLAIGDHLVAQILMAVLVGCVVAVADIYFLMKKLHNLDVEDADRKKPFVQHTEGKSAEMLYQKSKND